MRWLVVLLFLLGCDRTRNVVGGFDWLVVKRNPQGEVLSCWELTRVAIDAHEGVAAWVSSNGIMYIVMGVDVVTMYPDRKAGMGYLGLQALPECIQVQ